MAIEYGCAINDLTIGLETYKGVKRRFTYQIKTDNFVFIDDYAHHPEEIKAVHLAIREMYPGKKVLAVFQPHLFSRTQDFVDEFAESLSKFDELLLLDIYPARELPIEGVTSKWLLEKIKNPNKKRIQKLIPAFVIIIGVLFIFRGLGLGIPYISPNINTDNVHSSMMECAP